MEHRIIGSVMPVLEVSLAAGESIVAESGELSWMSPSISLSTSTKGAGSKGLFHAVKRALGGGSFFMTQYTAERGPGNVAFATKVPGSILPIEVGNGVDYVIHHHGYLCGTAEVELSIAFQQSLGAGLFGGAGFILQRVAGNGMAWVELDGELVQYTLQTGESLLVHPGHVGMLDATVSFDITRIPGIKNMIFGGDGVFLVALTGPGRVWLQSLPLPNLAHALTPYMPQASDPDRSSPGGMLGGIAGGIFGGND